MSGDKKSQKVGKNGVGLLADRDIIINDYKQMKEVFCDLFEANFYRFKGVAKKVAQECMEEFNEEFLKALEDRNPQGLNQAQTPGYMSAVFEAQKGYAKSGDEDLGKLLIDLLVERSKEVTRSVKQLVLDESIISATKITHEQINLLSMIFLINHTMNHGVRSDDTFGKYCDDFIRPLMNDTPPSHTDFQYLEYVGCGSVHVKTTIENAFAKNYLGLFTKGFKASEVIIEELSKESHSKLLIPCLADDSKRQINAMTRSHLESLLEEYKTPKREHEHIFTLFTKGTMNAGEIQKKCVSLRPYTKQFFSDWNNSPLNYFRLTSVGIAIGHANIARMHANFADINLWVNDTPAT